MLKCTACPGGASLEMRIHQPIATAAAFTLTALTALLGCSAGRDSATRVTAAVYHVSPSGNDADPGTADQPWRTIQHAADIAGPGDTLLVHAGTYAEDVRFQRSGTSGAPIAFQTAPTERVIVRSLQPDQGASHLRLTGFRVRGYRIWGVTLIGDNQDVILSRLNVSGGEGGIHFTDGYSGEPPAHGPVTDILVEDCSVHDVRYTGIDATPGPCLRTVFRRVESYGNGLVGQSSFGADGIGIERGQDVTVEDCFVHDNGGDGIDLNSRDRTGGVGAIIVRGNVVARNHLQGIKLWSGGRMERNVVWGQGINPIMIGAYDCRAEVLHNAVAYNMWDAAYSARDYAATFGYPEQAGAAPRVRLVMRNNIWAFNTGPAVGSPTGIYFGPRVQLLDERRNVFHSRADGEIQAAFLGDRWFSRADIRNGTWAAVSGHGQDDLAVNPLFVSGWPSVDLHLRPASPALGRGAY